MRKHRSDFWISLLTLLLLAVGLIIIFAIGPMRANVMNSTYGTEYSDNYFFIHQLVSVLISIGAFIVAYNLPYAQIRRFARLIFFVGILLCILLWIFATIGSSLASCQLGACRWINIGGGISIQPAEFVKLGLVLYLAQLLAERKKEGNLDDFRGFWIPFLIIFGVSMFFVVIIQKDLGTGMAIAAIAVSMLFMSGVKLKDFAIFMGAFAVLALIAIFTSPHRMERLTTFWAESSEGASSNSYHIENALIAIGSGGLTGVGVGNSVQATGYLPESINDSVFAVMGETFGLVGLLIIIGAFTLLLSRLLRTSNYLKDDEESLVLIGITGWIFAHVAINIMAMTGLIPLTGITLPLLSYGGTSMLFTTAALGIAAQLSKYTSRSPRQEKKELDSPRGTRRLVR